MSEQQDDHTVMVFKGEVWKIINSVHHGNLLWVRCGNKLTGIDLSQVDWDAYIAAALRNLRQSYPYSSLKGDTHEEDRITGWPRAGLTHDPVVRPQHR